jgi:uncharacterized membrane protein
VLTLLLLRKEKPEEQIINLSVYRNLITVAAVILVYMMNLLELRHHMNYVFTDDPEFSILAIGTYNMLFLLVLLLAESRLTNPGNTRNAFAFIGVLAVLMYLGNYYGHLINSRDNMVLGNYSPSMGLHYPFVILLIAVSAISVGKIKKLKEFNMATRNAYSWFYVAFFVFLASTELDNIVLLSVGNADNLDHVLTQNHKIGYPILWGLTSFLLIAIGLKMKLKHLRIISLTLFLITLLKLFTVDIRGISEGGKIAAFISLGILLLVVSFMYQRLKKILLTDDKPVVE